MPARSVLIILFLTTFHGLAASSEYGSCKIRQKSCLDQIAFDGIKGEKGPGGDQGEDGDNGAKGDKGDRGETGEPGLKGYPGETGDLGDLNSIDVRGILKDILEQTNGDHDLRQLVDILRVYSKGEAGGKGAKGEPMNCIC